MTARSAVDYGDEEKKITVMEKKITVMKRQITVMMKEDYGDWKEKITMITAREVRDAG